jgi:hypothetical protein
MSKFYQQKFHFTNEDAGHISALPWMVAAMCTPAFGYIVQNVFTESSYETLLLFSQSFIMLVHLSFLLLGDMKKGVTGSFLDVAPAIILGVGHALFTTLYTPISNKLILDKAKLPLCFSFLHIA